MAGLNLILRKISHPLGMTTSLNTTVIKMFVAIMLVILIMLRIEYLLIPFWQSPTADNVEAPAVIQKKMNVEKYEMSELRKLDLFSAEADDRSKNIYRVGYLSLEDPLLFQAPVSHLPVSLVGVLSSNIHKNSIAIIEHNKRQSPYIQGEELPDNNAVVVKIFTDRIIIDQQGYYKSLLLN
ncbi:type II secretion system protein N [Yersinia bercovieri]|uniref:type II secretion system protein N n=1 Tax=Yersinia bercovieri TaxID=634 RepID=UPI001643D8A6|nr:type II secretion system protein N [Yersinia bercovieri]